MFGFLGDFLEGGDGGVVAIGCCTQYLEVCGCLLFWTA